MPRARNELAQIAHHLAAVAHAKRERALASEKRRELVAGARVEQDRFRPTLARAQDVAVGEAAAGRSPLNSDEATAPGNDVAHVHVVRCESGAVERRRHLHLAVDALLAQDGDRRPGTARNDRVQRRLRSDRMSTKATGPDRRRPGSCRIPGPHRPDCRATAASHASSRTMRDEGRSVIRRATCFRLARSGCGPRTSGCRWRLRASPRSPSARSTAATSPCTDLDYCAQLFGEQRRQRVAARTADRSRGRNATRMPFRRASRTGRRRRCRDRRATCPSRCSVWIVIEESRQSRGIIDIRTLFAELAVRLRQRGTAEP